MTDLSFYTFIQEDKTRARFSKIRNLNETHVFMLYAEYLRWLADASARLNDAPKLRVRDYLAQLKVITDYYVFLLKRQSNKRLIHGIDLPPVPETLLQDDREKLNAVFPLKKDFKESALEFAEAKRHHPNPLFTLFHLANLAVLIVMLALMFTVPAVSTSTLIVSLFTGPVFGFTCYTALLGLNNEWSWFFDGYHRFENLPKTNPRYFVASLALGVTCALLAFTQPFSVPHAVKVLLITLPGIVLPCMAAIIAAKGCTDAIASAQKLDFVVNALDAGSICLDPSTLTQCTDYVKADIPAEHAGQVKHVDAAVKATLCTYLGSKLKYATPKIYDDETLPVKEIAEVFKPYRLAP